MSTQRKATRANEPTDVQRASREVAARLEALGIVLDGRELPEDLAQIEEAVEQFEHAVEAAGGDLMVDEGMGRPASAPDDPHFALPVRREHETVSSYVERLARATDGVRRHQRR